MDHIDISREIQTIRILLPQKTTEFEKDAITFSKVIKKINKYNDVTISRFDEIDKINKIGDFNNVDNDDNIDKNVQTQEKMERQKYIVPEEDDDIESLMFPNGYSQKQRIDDVHIYIGDINSEWFKYAHKKFYLFDHESFKQKLVNFELSQIDGVLCRTTTDLEIVNTIKNQNNFKFKIYNTKFTSVFQEKPVLKHWNVILHFAGEYHRKQTGEIIKTWQTYPDLPLVIIICTEQCFRNVEDLLGTGGKPKNMHFHKRWLDPEDFILIKNKMGIHLCPSAIEGYGHSINDARKIKSLVITTNIAPINELVDESCAIMIECSSHDTKKNGADLCIVSKEAIYESVMKAVKMDIDDRKKLTDVAYERFLEDTYLFEIAMMDLLNDSKPEY